MTKPQNIEYPISNVEVPAGSHGLPSARRTSSFCGSIFDILRFKPSHRRVRRSQAHTRNGYSIVELLGVLVVIGILIGLVLPAIRVVQRTSEKRRARAEATALVQAVMHYRQEYGHWPMAEELPSGSDPDSGSNIVAGVEFNEFPGWLVNTSGIPNITVDQSALIDALRPDSTFNPRAISFLEIPDNCIDEHNRYVDPWRQPYIVILEPEITVAGWPVGDVPAVAFSFGPPATGSKGLSNLVFSTEVEQ